MATEQLVLLNLVITETLLAKFLSVDGVTLSVDQFVVVASSGARSRSEASATGHI